MRLHKRNWDSGSSSTCSLLGAEQDEARGKLTAGEEAIFAQDGNGVDEEDRDWTHISTSTLSALRETEGQALL